LPQPVNLLDLFSRLSQPPTFCDFLHCNFDGPLFSCPSFSALSPHTENFLELQWRPCRQYHDRHNVHRKRYVLLSTLHANSDCSANAWGVHS